MKSTKEYPIFGSCQCGELRYEVSEPFEFQYACHCNDCQKLSAASFSLSAILKVNTFNILSGTLKKWNRVSDSGKDLDCFFCEKCGNRIYHSLSSQPEYIRLKSGSLEDTSIINPVAHYWVKRKQDWVVIPQGVKTYETQPE